MKLISTETRAISQAASQIAGAIFDEAEGTLEERLEAAIARENLGTDSDLSSSDRDALKLLLDAATGITSDLCDSDTTEVIREATMEEAIESALARPEGHIWVDGRSCYVSF